MNSSAKKVGVIVLIVALLMIGAFLFIRFSKNATVPSNITEVSKNTSTTPTQIQVTVRNLTDEEIAIQAKDICDKDASLQYLIKKNCEYWYTSDESFCQAAFTTNISDDEYMKMSMRNSAYANEVCKNDMYYAKALRTKDISYCDKIQGEDQEEVIFCHSILGVDLCGQIINKSEQRACTITKLNSADECKDKFVDTPNQNFCRYVVSLKRSIQTNNISECNNAPEGLYRMGCNLLNNQYSVQISNCTDEMNKFYCYNSKTYMLSAFIRNDESYCYEIYDDVQRQYCLHRFGKGWEEK